MSTEVPTLRRGNVNSVYHARRPQTPGRCGGRAAGATGGFNRGRGQPTFNMHARGRAAARARRRAQWNAPPRFQGRFNSNQQTCQQCNQTGHKSEHCTAPFWCYICTRRGHSTVACPYKDQANTQFSRRPASRGGRNFRHQNNNTNAGYSASEATFHTATLPQEDVDFNTFITYDTSQVSPTQYA